MIKLLLTIINILICFLGKCSWIESTSIHEDQVKFYYYPYFDRQMNSFEQINLENLAPLKFKKDHVVYVIIDGFLSNLQASMSQSVKDNLLKSRPNANVIVVDWSKLSGSKSLKLKESTEFMDLLFVYNMAKSKVEHVGNEVTRLLTHLVDQKITTYSKIHIIGYSLGAHIAGVAGRNIIEKYNGRIIRITGLDPAGIGFPMEKRNKRLDKSDAEFVDIYFTNRYTAGDTQHNVGHIDVYVNGGRQQPGCSFPNIINSTVCNHAFSWKAWNKCITEKCAACPCDSFECLNCSGTCKEAKIVGLDISPNTRGDYYLKLGPFLP